MLKRQWSRSKRLSLEVVRPGSRVLYAGIGRGAEAIEAAARGAHVTGIDVSAAMLGRLRGQLDSRNLSAELIESDASTYRSAELFDVIVANYFLNLFEPARARAMIDRLSASLRPGGLFVVADFARPSGGAFARWLSELYYRPINGVAWMLGLCALHPILDYPSLLDPESFDVVSKRRLPIL